MFQLTAQLFIFLFLRTIKLYSVVFKHSCPLGCNPVVFEYSCSLGCVPVVFKYSCPLGCVPVFLCPSVY